MEAERLHVQAQLLLEKVGFAFALIFNMLLETETQLTITCWKLNLGLWHSGMAKCTSYSNVKLIIQHDLWLPFHMHVQ